MILIEVLSWMEEESKVYSLQSHFENNKTSAQGMQCFFN